MDVLLVGMCGNDKRVPPLCPAHSQFIADTVRLLRGDLARIEGLSYLIAQHIIFYGARNGAYVMYNHEAMLGVLAIEATRAGGMVIGEDLGTVPDYEMVSML